MIPYLKLLLLKLVILAAALLLLSCSTYMDSGVQKERNLHKVGYPTYRVYDIKGHWIHSNRCCGIKDSFYVRNSEHYQVGDVYEIIK